MKEILAKELGPFPLYIFVIISIQLLIIFTMCLIDKYVKRGKLRTQTGIILQMAIFTITVLSITLMLILAAKIH